MNQKLINFSKKIESSAWTIVKIYIAFYVAVLMAGVILGLFGIY